MQKRFRVITVLTLLLSLFLAPLNSHAGNGDAGAKGKQMLIWHFDEGKGKDVKEDKGKADGKIVGDINWVTGKNVFIGGENNACCPRFFQGRIDEITITNYALSTDEVKNLMKSSLGVEALDKLASTWGKMKSGKM